MPQFPCHSQPKVVGSIQSMGLKRLMGSEVQTKGHSVAESVKVQVPIVPRMTQDFKKCNSLSKWLTWVNLSSFYLHNKHCYANYVYVLKLSKNVTASCGNQTSHPLYHLFCFDGYQRLMSRSYCRKPHFCNLKKSWKKNFFIVTFFSVDTP